jgi:excisionase family DNA binding protein
MPASNFPSQATPRYQIYGARFRGFLLADATPWRQAERRLGAVWAAHNDLARNPDGTVDSLCDNARMRNDATVLLSVGEVAERLGLHKATIYRYVHEGSLPALRLGETGPWRIRSDRLEEWLQRYPAAPREETYHGRTA